MDSAHFCYDCTFKHLSRARVLWNEVMNGYENVDHIGYVVGHMASAEEHIFERHPKIANEIREGRKKFWDSCLAGDIERPEFEIYLQHVWDAAITIDVEKVDGIPVEDLQGALALNLDLQAGLRAEETGNGEEERTGEAVGSEPDRVGPERGEQGDNEG